MDRGVDQLREIARAHAAGDCREDWLTLKAAEQLPPTIRQGAQIPDEMVEEVYAAAYEAYQEKRGQEAAEQFTALVLIDPLDVRFWKGLTATYQLLKEWQKAIEGYEVVRLLDPKDEDGYVHAAFCCEQLGDRQGIEQIRFGWKHNYNE